LVALNTPQQRRRHITRLFISEHVIRKANSDDVYAVIQQYVDGDTGELPAGERAFADKAPGWHLTYNTIHCSTGPLPLLVMGNPDGWVYVSDPSEVRDPSDNNPKIHDFSEVLHATNWEEV
jgi:hypothetical protein